MSGNNWKKTKKSYLNWLEENDLKFTFNKKLKYKNYSLWWSTIFPDRDIITDDNWYLNLHHILNKKKIIEYPRKSIFYLTIKLIKKFLFRIFINIFIKITYKEKKTFKNSENNCFFSQYTSLIKHKGFVIDRMYGSTNHNKRDSYLINLSLNFNLIKNFEETRKKLSKLPKNYYILEKHLGIKDILKIYFLIVCSFFKLIFILRKKNFFIINKIDCSKILKPMLIESFFGKIQEELLLGVACKNFLKKKIFKNFINYLEFYPNARSIYYFIKNNQNRPQIVSVNHVIGEKRYFFSISKKEFSKKNNSLLNSYSPDIFFSTGEAHTRFLKKIFVYNKNIFTIGSFKNELSSLKRKKIPIKKNLLLIIFGEGDSRHTIEFLNKCNLAKYKIVIKFNPHNPYSSDMNLNDYCRIKFKFKYQILQNLSTREVIDFAGTIITGGSSSMDYESVVRRRKLNIIRIRNNDYPLYTEPYDKNLSLFKTFDNPKSLQIFLDKNKNENKKSVHKFIKDYFYKYDQNASKRFKKILETKY